MVVTLPVLLLRMDLCDSGTKFTIASCVMNAYKSAIIRGAMGSGRTDGMKDMWGGKERGNGEVGRKDGGKVLGRKGQGGVCLQIMK